MVEMVSVKGISWEMILWGGNGMGFIEFSIEETLHKLLKGSWKLYWIVKIKMLLVLQYTYIFF